MSPIDFFVGVLFGFSAGVMLDHSLTLFWRARYISRLETRIAALEAALDKLTGESK